MMIYKFRFEVCNDNNELLFARSEESGDFWWAFSEFIYYIMTYTKQHGVQKK